MSSSDTSKKRESVISWILMIAALGFLSWRVYDCKQKEQDRDTKLAAMKAEEEGKAQARVDACLQTVPKEKQGPCLECTCKRCLDEWESCHRDRACEAITTVTTDNAPDAGPAMLRHQARTQCMVEKCLQACVGAPESPDGSAQPD